MAALSLTAAFIALTSLAMADATFQSTSTRTHLLELYTSEGCSSCPPAEAWLSQLRNSPRLWKEIVPIAFHVDYWDGLGWPDRFASNANTGRQRAYAAAWGTGTVYTPGFVLDGREWRERALDRIPAGGDAGVLRATVRDNRVIEITYTPTRAGAWEAHAALLGFDLNSDVKAGENSGRKLLHDFVVLAQTSKALTPQVGAASAELTLPAHSANGKLGMAIWITAPGSLAPIQATGGTL